MPGKIHNIETIQEKVDEQNLIIFSVKAVPSAKAPAGYALFNFSIPLLIHSTVLPPNSAGTLETYIPMTAKLYINFLKVSESSAGLRGRYTSDCLLGDSYVPISSMKSQNPSVEPMREKRIVLKTTDTQLNRIVLGGSLFIGISLLISSVLKKGPN
jgi:hypothetical protein